MREGGEDCGGEAGWVESGSRNELSGFVTGPVVQARVITGGIHVHAPAVGVLERTPRQLPPDAALFTGRAEDLATLDGFWARSQSNGTGALLVVCGTAGVGKSALAVHWLRQHTETFPDGHLYADLGGYSPGGPVPPQEVAGAFLRALGVDPASVPDTPAERVALLRSITSDRRIGVLLENPVSAAQVRVLALTGPGCATMVTARQTLSGLTIDGARVHRLEPWRPETAVRLMERMLGEERVSAEPAEALKVARLCGGLPLAVGVAGARLAARPRWPLARLAQTLATDTERLQALALDEEHAVRPALDGSYRALPALQQRLYRLLGFSPLRWFDPSSAAAAAGADQQECVEELLDALVDASLLEALTDRYRFHDLVRVHAADCARREEPEPERDAAVTRVTDFYLHTATRIETALTPSHRLLERDYRFATPVVLAFPDEAASLDWLDAQRPNLMAILRHGAAHHRYRHTWRLAYAMWPLFLRRRYPDDRLEAQTLALAAARAEGHRVAEGNLLTSLAGTLATAGQLREAAEFNQQALTVYEQLGDQRGLAQACNGLAKIHLELGELPQAHQLFERARELRAAIGYWRGVYLSHQGLGRVMSAQGDIRTAAWHLRRAYRGLARLGDRYDAAWSLALWAQTVARRGQPRRALRLLDRAQATMRDVGSPHGRAGIDEIIGQIHQDAGDPVAARGHYAAAAHLFAGINPRAEARLHARLADLDNRRSEDNRRP
jgi:tetratricopeptide (TPR) repeat protein